MSPPWMLLRLAIETRTHHNAADEDRLSLMDVKTRAECRSFLVRIYGFESAVEEAIMRVKELDSALIRERCKAERLKHDLFALGLTPEVLEWMPRLKNVPIRTAPQALGWLFVLERSTLVAGILRRHLEQTLGDSLCGAVRYFSTYDNPGARLRALGDCLGGYAHQYSPALIVAAANEAFRAQLQWYRGFGRTLARGTGSGESPVLQLHEPAPTTEQRPIQPLVVPVPDTSRMLIPQDDG